MITNPISEVLTDYISDLEEHLRYMNSVSNTFSLSSKAPRKSKVGGALAKVEKDFEKFKAPKGFIPKPIAESYMRETRIALDFIHRAPISPNHAAEKERLAATYRTETFRGFRIQSGAPSYYMTGQFTYMIMQSVKNYDKPSKKILSIVSIFNIGLRNIFDDDMLSPYQGIVKDSDYAYLQDIAKSMRRKGIVGKSNVRFYKDITKGGVKDGNVATDSRFFGLTTEGQEKIFRQTRKYLSNYYKDSVTTNIRIAKSVVSTNTKSRSKQTEIKASL